MNPRRVKINMRKLNIGALLEWLDDNDYKYAMVPSSQLGQTLDPSETVVGDLTLFIELYTGEAETALRLAWDVE